MLVWIERLLSLLALLLFLTPLTEGMSKNVDCVHCGKSRIEVSFAGTNVEVVNTSISQITDIMSKSRGRGNIISQKDSNYICAIVTNPLPKKEDNIKIFHMTVEEFRKRYKFNDFMEIYNSIHCHGGVSLLSTTMLFGNNDVARELFKMHVPVNTVNEYGETELDFYLKSAKAVKKHKVGNLNDIGFFTRVFRGNKRSYDVPLLTCEIEGTCKCPFALPNFGAECTPPQS